MPRALKLVLLLMLPLVIFLLSLRGCFAFISTDHSSNPTEARQMDTGTFEIKLGEYGKDLVAHTSMNVRQGSVAGLTFYEVSDIATRTEPTVRLNHGRSVLELPQARSVMMGENTGKGWPIGRAVIHIKMPELPKDPTDAKAMEEYDFAVFTLYQKIVGRIRSAGWKRYIDLYEPRIAGFDTYNFSEGYRTARAIWSPPPSPDPDIELTREDWRHLDGGAFWYWYIPDAMIMLSYSRGTHTQEYNAGDTFRLEISNDRTLLISYDPKKNSNLDAGIENYKAMIPGELAKRKEAEQKAIDAGIPILTHYIDPPIGGISIPAN